MCKLHPPYKRYSFYVYGEEFLSNEMNFLSALVALLFPEMTEAAFANYHCTKAASFTVYFVISLYVCVKVKLIVVIVVLVLGSILYVGVEISVRRNNNALKK